LPRASSRSLRQKRALNKEAFTEGSALGIGRPSAKKIFAEGSSLGKLGFGPSTKRPHSVRSDDEVVALLVNQAQFRMRRKLLP